MISDKKNEIKKWFMRWERKGNNGKRVGQRTRKMMHGGEDRIGAPGVDER
jgi:hypothetical protein